MMHRDMCKHEMNLKNVQVLSHQYKIASKLELFVGTCADGDKMSYQKCKWKRLALQHTAHCNALQHAATHCNTPQHIAVH